MKSSSSSPKFTTGSFLALSFSESSNSFSPQVAIFTGLPAFSWSRGTFQRLYYGLSKVLGMNESRFIDGIRGIKGKEVQFLFGL